MAGNNGDIKIARVRHFYEFESVNTVIHKEEITLYYKGIETKKLQYFALKFKDFLSILDSNGEQLQFHSEISNYFDIGSEESKKREDAVLSSDQNDGFEIFIEFPQTRPLLQNEFRTILLIERIDYSKRLPPGSPYYLIVPFDEASHTYVYITKLPQYRATIDIAFYCREDVDPKTNVPIHYFKPEQTEEKQYIDQFETRSFYCISASTPVTNCNIIIFIGYQLRIKDSIWFWSGGLLGCVTLLLNGYLISKNLSGSMEEIGLISTLVITFLAVIKGWVFTGDSDDVASILITNRFDLPIKIHISDFYILLIIAIFLEMAIAFYLGNIDQNITDKVQIIIENLNQNVFMLKI